MEQLGGVDSFWLNVEQPRMPMHVAGVMILDPSTAPDDFGIDHIRRLFEKRIHLIPQFRRRLVEVPGNVDHPYWIEDPEYDMEYHIRHRALPRPGTKEQLIDLVTHIFSRPLDRSRPLWEYYLIEGLEGGLMASITKIHHAAIDGVSSAELMVHLLDLAPGGRNVPPPKSPWRPDKIPSSLELLARSGASYIRTPRKALDTIPQTWGAISAAARKAFRSENETELTSVPFNAPHSRFNKQISAHRSWSFTSLPLEEAKKVKNALGCTLNDAVLAITGGAIRRYLLDKADLPERPLLAAVPISVRSESEKLAGGNRLSFMFCSLGTDVDDPLERIKAIQKSTEQGKAGQKTIGANLLQDWTKFAAPAVLARAGKALAQLSASHRFAPMFNLAVSNVPGPQFPLYWAGAKVVDLYPLSLVFDGAGLNITIMSYDGKVEIGITADRTTVPDTDRLTQYMADELAEYLRIIEQMDTSQGQS